MGARRPSVKAELEVRLLGPLEVLKRGETIPLGGAKPRALLASLALETGRVVSVDRLIESLWPGSAPETAAHAVQVYVSQLRKLLGPRIATRVPGYVLELDAERIDVHRFVRLVEEGRAALGSGDTEAGEAALREALALWRGPALADFLYEPFAQADIARLEELRLLALEDRIAADLELGRHVELVSELEALVQAEPLRERPRGQLMLALYRSGRQADALSAYRAARETLVEELGIEPGAELRQLEASILRQDESLHLPQTAPARPAMQFRRLVTILFVDVVESIALAERLDAEALGGVLRRYFETVSAVLTRHGGTVEKFAGDAVMAAFGFPVSHEDDALRAARSALDIRVALAALNEQLVREYGVELEVRIGLEAGEVLASPAEARERLVTGEAVGIAAKLQQAAAADEILVGELGARLIDHAAALEPLGEVEIKGRREPIRTYRVLEITPAAPAFARRLDAPLVGRRRELAALRKALKASVDTASTRVTLVVGPAGVGKSRVAAELTRRAKGVTALWGRCLSYGDGITYWPLRDVVRQAPASEERDAVLAALEAETPPPAPEIALSFRHFCEALALEKPLLLVFDDVHWAEPTLLELLELLTDRAEGPIFLVCLAREELLEERPEYLQERANGERLVLDALSEEEAEALVDGLGGAVLESDQRARIVEAAEGNPFFVEQLLALAVEGGLVERALPATVQALLAARLDRLGPGERAVLERGAVVGKEFREGDVVALLDPAAAPTVPAHLETLSARGFVRPAGEKGFAFRHVLVQQAVYRAAPKRLRAELHERFAGHLDRTSAELTELDEFVGFHLERAYHLRRDLGESDRRTGGLAEDGGRRLAAAGRRAFRRADMPATTSLFARATSLLPPQDPLRREVSVDLGLTLYATDDVDGAIDVLTDVIAASRRAGDRRIEVWARIELEYIKLQRHPRKTADALVKAASGALPILESAGDDRAVGRALVLSGWVQGARRNRQVVRTESAERALAHYRSAGWSTATCLGEIAAGLYWGPAPVSTAIARFERLLDDDSSDHAGRAYVVGFLGGLVAQQGEFERARELVETARATLEDLGLHAAARGYQAHVLSEVERLARNDGMAQQLLSKVCDTSLRLQEYGLLTSSASELADVLVSAGALDEAGRWTALAKEHTATDDMHAKVRWCAARARIEARRGDVTFARDLAEEAVRVGDAGDELNRRAKTERDLAEVLLLGGDSDGAAAAFDRAIDLYEQKENVVGAAQTREQRGELAFV